VVIRASRTAFEPLQRYRVAESDTWTPPVISGNRVFIKDVQALSLWSWSDGPPASDALVHAQAPVGTTASPSSAVSPDTLLRADILFWESIKDKTDPALFDAYLRQFPTGTFRVLAAARARELRRRAPVDDDAQAFEDAGDSVIRWANIPGGRFQMGCVPGDLQCRDDEKPRHPVEVAPFRMMTHDVTVGVFRAHADQSESSSMPVQPDWNLADAHPVVAVSWADAAAFCEARGWRLPTEAEWEYAARGGLDAAIYAWGSKTTPMIDGRPRANVADEAARRRRPGWTDIFAGYDDGFAETSPVGAFPPNAFGLFDMAGNVWRWTSTLARPYPYRADDGREDPSSPDRRVLRGGSWVTGPRGLRLSYRVADDPRDEDDNHGFRCVQPAS
jgi:formylglycine-generating enzyme required for sulfatase activity